MIKYLVHLLVFITLCVVLATCKHEPPPEPPKVCQYDSSIEEMKKWYYFKTGTQWIYQEQTTGELDTVTVYDHADGSDWFDFYEFHTYGGWLVNYWHDPSWSFPCLTTNECSCHKVFRSRGKPGNYVGEASLFIYPHILNNYAGLYGEAGEFGQKTVLIGIRDSIILNDSTYFQIATWEASSDASESHDSTEYSIAKNIGIVQQRILETNKDWCLISYSIIQ